MNKEQFYENLDTETKRIANWINKTESPLEVCELFIHNLIIDIDGLSHYNALGMLEELKLRFREFNVESLNEN